MIVSLLVFFFTTKKSQKRNSDFDCKLKYNLLNLAAKKNDERWKERKLAKKKEIPTERYQMLSILFIYFVHSALWCTFNDSVRTFPPFISRSLFCSCENRVIERKKQNENGKKDGKCEKSGNWEIMNLNIVCMNVSKWSEKKLMNVYSNVFFLSTTITFIHFV